ncbi:MAG: apolipoprotein N-acyltransferase, partial [Acidimicrobiales bacterium]
MARFGGGGLVAGLLLTATLPPFGWWFLGPVGVSVLFLVLEDAPGGWWWRLLAGIATGLGLYGPALWWATEFHAVGWVALVLVESALLTLALIAIPPDRVALGLPAALVMAEAVRGAWPFGGLPLAGLDLGQVDGPLLPVARLGGHLLVVAAVGVAGVGLAELLRRRWAAVATAAVATVAVVVG